MLPRLVVIALAATLATGVATPAFAAPRDDVKDAAAQLRAEKKLDHRFEAARKQWEHGFDKQKSAPMLSAGKKLTAWVEDAVAEIPKRVLRDARDGEDDTVRERYAADLLALKASLAKNGGDGKPKADAATHDLLRELDKAVGKRVAVREAQLTRAKAALKASKGR
jgi:hypothetical protein